MKEILGKNSLIVKIFVTQIWTSYDENFRFLFKAKSTMLQKDVVIRLILLNCKSIYYTHTRTYNHSNNTNTYVHIYKKERQTGQFGLRSLAKKKLNNYISAAVCTFILVFPFFFFPRLPYVVTQIYI